MSADPEPQSPAAQQLSPDMEKPALDEFLTAAFGVQSNPFTVQEIFDGARAMNETAWTMIQRLLQLNDLQSSRLIIALNNARNVKKAAHAQQPPREKQVVSTVDHNRAEWLANAKPGDHTSIFGRDEQNRPLTKDGGVQERATSWDQLGLKSQRLQGSNKSAHSGAFSKTAGKKLEDKANKKLALDEKEALPLSTLRMSRPTPGWDWRPDIKWAHQNRAELALFLQAGINEAAVVGQHDGSDSAGVEYMEFTNVSDTRKAELTKAHGINFYPKSGGAQAVVGAISKVMRALADEQQVKEERAAGRRELEKYTSVLDVEAAAAAHARSIEESFKEKTCELNEQLISISQEIALKASDPTHVLPLAGKLGKVQAELASLLTQEEKAKSESLTKFEVLREQVSSRLVKQVAPPRREKPKGFLTNGTERQRAPPAPSSAVALALSKAREAQLKRKVAELDGTTEAAASANTPSAAMAAVRAPVTFASAQLALAQARQARRHLNAGATTSPTATPVAAEPVAAEFTSVEPAAAEHAAAELTASGPPAAVTGSAAVTETDAATSD